MCFSAWLVSSLPSSINVKHQHLKEREIILRIWCMAAQLGQRICRAITTVKCLDDTAKFLQNRHNKHPIARLWGLCMWWLLSVSTLNHILIQQPRCNIGCNSTAHNRAQFWGDNDFVIISPLLLMKSLWVYPNIASANSKSWLIEAWRRKCIRKKWIFMDTGKCLPPVWCYVPYISMG